MGGERETKRTKKRSLSLSLSTLFIFLFLFRFESIDHASHPRSTLGLCSKLDSLPPPPPPTSVIRDSREFRPPTRNRGDARARNSYVETQFVNEDAWFCSTNRIPSRCTYARRGQENTGTRLAGTLVRLSSFCLSSQQPSPLFVSPSFSFFFPPPPSCARPPRGSIPSN